MEPGRKPKWTKDDTVQCAKFGVFFVGCGTIWGLISGEGLRAGALAGAALWAMITIGALGYVAYWALRR